MDRAAITALRRSHGYPQFLAAATVARLADEMFAVGVVLLVLERTDSPSLAGGTVAAATLPGMLSGPVIGAWLDRTGRRSLIYKVDRLLLSAVLVAILLAAGHTPNFVVPLLAFVTGLTLPVTLTGFTSMLPLIVEQETLPSANAVEAASLNVALIGGPALAGVTAGLGGPPAAIVVEIALTLVALVLILRIPDLNRGAAEEPLPLGRLVADGLRHIRHDRVLRIVSAAGVVNNTGWGVLMVVFPLWAAADLDASRSASGAIWAAFASGSLVGALALARIQARHAQEWVLFAGMVVMGAGMLTWELAGSLPVALVLVVLTAVVEGPAMAAVFSIRQQRTPPGLQAQVMGTLGSIQIGAFAIGSAIGGPLVAGFGPRVCIVIVGAAIVLAGAISAAVRATVRDPTRL
ncbi:MAG TPA: MFS transporter [Thermoleophilaceae bacterium]|nr:MFS transporter [Thermoleophilaceae bacterium]